MTIRYGLIGYGAWGSHHALAIEGTPGAKLVAIAAGSEESAGKAREQHPNVDMYTDYTELVKREDIDVVDIVVPNYLHLEAAQSALHAGKHILLEKPMAITVEQCRQLIDTAESRGLTIQIGFQLHFSPLWGKVKSLIDEGAIGELKTAHVHLSRFPYRNGAGGWRKDAVRVGNWILEEPIHFYDLVRWYFSGSEEPVSLYSLGNSRDEATEADRLYENIATGISFSKGGYATVNQTLAAYGHYLTGEFIGTKGVLKAVCLGASDRVRDPVFQLQYFDGEQLRELKIDGTPGELYELEYQLAQFTQVIAEKGQPSVTGEDGLWAVRLSLAAQQSIEQKEIITFT
ncbi:MAG: oxidoreductase domain protein [Paenibacillus sp.]|nr:oxidoreductase domain protein [Paenibacillus sp.]